MKTILCYGDSNTWGYMPKAECPACDSVNRFDWDTRWTGRVQKALGADYRIIEEGLNGRTTAIDCLLENDRNGLTYIDVALKTHTPIDLVIIILGTNDVKPFLNSTPYVIAHSLERLVERVRTGNHGVNAGDPEILIAAPIRLNASAPGAWLGEEFDESALEKDAQLGRYFEKTAEKLKTHFLNAGAFITADPADGVHMNEAGHARMAELMTEKIKEILG